MDATTAARARVDQALTRLERKLLDMKARAAVAGSGDDDLFAALPPSDADRARIAELEEAGRDASAALARAADELRDLLRETG